MSGSLDHEALVAQIEAKVRAEILAQSTNLAPQPAGHAAAGSRGGPAAGSSGGPAAGSVGGSAAGNRGGAIAGSGGAGTTGFQAPVAYSCVTKQLCQRREVEVVLGGSTAKETTSVRRSRAHHGDGSPAPVGWCASLSCPK